MLRCYTLHFRKKKPFWKHRNGVAASSWSRQTKLFKFWMIAQRVSTRKIDNSTKKNCSWGKRIDSWSKCDPKWSIWLRCWRPTKHRRRRRRLKLKAKTSKVKTKYFSLSCFGHKLNVFLSVSEIGSQFETVIWKLHKCSWFLIIIVLLISVEKSFFFGFFLLV